MLVKAYIPEAINKIDQFPQVVEEGLVGLLVTLHSDILLNTIFTIKYDHK